MNKPFDSLSYAKRAMSIGISEPIAEFHAKELSRFYNDQPYVLQELEGLRNDIKTLKHDVLAEMRNKEIEFASKMHDAMITVHSLESKLTWRLLGGVTALLSIFTILQHMGGVQ